MKWRSIEDSPDAKNYFLLVYAPKGLYEEDFEEPTIRILMWYKTRFGEFHDEHIRKITHWMPLPEPPSEKE